MLALPLHLKKTPKGTMALTQLEKEECSGDCTLQRDMPLSASPLSLFIDRYVDRILMFS